MNIRVYYDDTDAGGIVYHANYLKFCERARSDVFFEKGLSLSVDGGHFVVKHIEADFIKSAKLGDLLKLKHEIIQVKNASITLKQNVWLEEIKLFEMTSVLVFAKNGRPTKMSLQVKEFFQSVF
jgi:acyl-CoA thioester hydrolase